MSTRGFVGFVAGGREVIAYNHSDSYPEWLGIQTLEWARSADLAAAASRATEVRLVDDDDAPTDADAEALTEFYDPNVGGRSERPTWYQLLRGTQGDLGAMLRAGYVEDASTFPANSLFAEWGYIVDFDAKCFEVYAGFQKGRHHDGRFADRMPANVGYWPVRLLASWPLDALPDDSAFYAAVSGDEGGD